MNLDEIGRVLAKAAAFDQRTIGEADVLAWREAIGDLDAADSLTAVTRFYGTVVGRRIMPGDIRLLAGEIDRERRRATLPPAIESWYPTDDRPLSDRRPEIREFVEQVRDVLPEGDPDALHWGRRQWRREQAVHHERVAEPNPLFDPQFARPVEWQRSNRKPEPCWWEDPVARERDAVEQLAAAGRLTAIPPEGAP